MWLLSSLAREFFVETAAAAAAVPPPEESRGPLRIVGLYLYPVKSCRGIQVPPAHSLTSYESWGDFEGS